MPITASIVAIAPSRIGSPYAYGNGVGTFQRGTNLYMACSNPGLNQTFVNPNPPPVLAQAHVLKSADGGATWNEIDEAGAPSVSLQRGSGGTARGITSPIAACYKDADTLLVAYFVWDYIGANPVEIRFSEFDLITETWGAETPGGPTIATFPSVAGNTLPLSIAYRASSGSQIILFQDYENVGGQNYARTFYVIHTGAWGAATPVDAAQTGSTLDYSVSGAVSGGSNRTHLFFSIIDPAAIIPASLNQNTLTGANALIGTVQITADLYDFGGRTSPVTRTILGTTTLFIGWVKNSDTEMYFSSAASADSPVFAEGLVDSAPFCNLAGVFNAGFAASAGLVGSTFENTDLTVTGSQDLSTWEVPTPITIPATPGNRPNTSFSGLGVDIGALPSAGIVRYILERAPD